MARAPGFTVKGSGWDTITGPKVDAIENTPPAAIPVTWRRSAGTCDTPPVPPHMTTVPSRFNAMLWSVLAAIATTPPRPAGTCVWPELLSPHAATVPSALSAKV